MCDRTQKTVAALRLISNIPADNYCISVASAVFLCKVPSQAAQPLYLLCSLLLCDYSCVCDHTVNYIEEKICIQKQSSSRLSPSKKYIIYLHIYMHIFIFAYIYMLNLNHLPLAIK